MPRLVDHAERRRAIIDAAWRLIAARGVEAATMREIAREAGYANGALTHYFADKEALLGAAYQHVYAATNARVADAVDGLQGIPALRAFCREVLPLDPVTLEEARLVLAVWSRAVVEPELGRVHTDAVAGWRRSILRWLGEARALGQVRTPSDDGVLADQLNALLMGGQVLALAGTAAEAVAALDAALEDFLGRLAQS